MKELKVGVIGCGAIGRDHVRRINDIVPEAKVVAVADYFKEAADKVAEKYGIKSFATGEDLIACDDVEAILITSTDPTHAGFVIESLKAGKYVFCEKPLAQTAEDCEKIMELESKAGKRLVQVGFMRRYDKGYSAMKKAIVDGEIGAPLMIHAAHRNVSQPDYFKTDMGITNVAIHELDISRWLMGEEYEEAQVLAVRQNTLTNGDYLNPQIVMLKTKSGARIDIEVQCSCAYAYDIQCQVVGEKGTINLPDPAMIKKRIAAEYKHELMTDWLDRFVEAYDIEFQEWAKAVLDGKLTGPSSWDGYIACVTADALIKSRQTGVAEKVVTVEKPAIYE